MAAGRGDAERRADTADRELLFTRVFNAPRDLVFRAWTQAEHVSQWWGPDGFTITSHEMDARPGGHWRFVMHGPDGTDFKNHVVFHEVVAPARLVYEHVPEPGTEPVRFIVTVTFDEFDGRTQLSMQMLFPSRAARDHIVQKYGADEGARQTLNRLAAFLDGR